MKWFLIHFAMQNYQEMPRFRITILNRRISNIVLQSALATIAHQNAWPPKLKGIDNR